MRLNRRNALIGATLAAAAALPFARVFRRIATKNAGRFGPLVRDPAGILDLPAGFSYRILQRAFEPMSDGYQVPGSFDGMGCFKGPDGTVVLMRNHENTWLPTSGPCRLGTSPPKEAFDPRAQGGVTRVVLREDTLDVVSSNLVLAGTVRNCAGGQSPWGWLSCEETTDDGHGYVFVCSTTASRVTAPERVPAYGRCRHEAAVVDPNSLIAYLTEDKDDGCLYRFVPSSRDTPFRGRLQAMAIRGHANFDTSRGLEVGQGMDVNWVDVLEPDPKGDTLRIEAHGKGAATVKRGEGLWLDGNRLFIASTTGGAASAGQIFSLALGSAEHRDRVTLLAESPDSAVLNMPDNIAVAPWGDLFMAEDSVFEEQFIRVLSPDGVVTDFARNAVSRSELAGVCFSPHGTTLFLNIYGDGLTIAVRGPFPSHSPHGAV